MTAPALPGAAPDPAPGRNDPARLPPEVEREIDAVVKEAGMAYTGHVNALPNALLDLRTAIARALGGDGEPVAWGYGVVRVVDGLKWGSVYGTRAEADNAIAGSPVGHYAVVPLYTRPAATGDTGEVEKAAVDALRWWFDRCGDPVDRETFKRECQRKFAAVLAMHDAATTRAATGGPDAR